MRWNGKFVFYGQTAVGCGVDVSTSLVSTDSAKNQLPHAMMDYAAFTVDFAFRPKVLPTASRRAFLFDYQFWSWGRSRWSVALEGDGSLTFFAAKKDEIDFKAVSAPVRLSVGKYHALRFQVAADGLFTAWLNGAEIAKMAGAPGFDKLVRKPADKYYPLLRMGVDDTDPNAIRHPFVGDFDNIRFYDVALGAPKIALPNCDYSRIDKVEYKPADATGTDLLVLDRNGHARTRRFTVMDHEGDALGLMVAADRKFVDTAATVDIAVDAERIVARFVCPVPHGMKVEKSVRSALEASAGGFAEGVRKVAVEACRPVAEAVRTHGGNPEAFVALETMFGNAEKALLQIRLAGMPLLAYEPRDVWGSTIAPDAMSVPLEMVRLKMPRNGKMVYGFAIANLRDHAFLGQFKCCSESPSKDFSCVAQSGIARKAAFYRGFPIWNRAGRELYDPVEPLSMKTLLRLAPKEYAPMYLELDAKGLEPGIYNALVYLKAAAPGYEDVRFGIEVEVTDLDVAAVKLDKAGYDYAGRSFAGRKDANGDLIRLLCERDYNTAFVCSMKFSPKADRDGNFSMGSYVELDRQIDEYLKYVSREDMKLWIYMITERHWYDPVDHRGVRFPFASEKWAEGVRFMVKGFKEHVKGKYGIGPDRIWWYTVDEPSGKIDDLTWKSKIAVAYRIGQEIKRESPENITMTNPLPNFLSSKDIDAALAKLRECYDIIELYRPGITTKTKALMERLAFPQVWSYSITTKETPAATYRRDYWENMRDGYREIATFWHMTQSAGGDAFDSTDWNSPGRLDDYATLYCNSDVEASILSRRQLQCDQGFWDMQILAALRAKYVGNAGKLAAIAEIVREAADTGTVKAIAARDRLLGL